MCVPSYFKVWTVHLFVPELSYFIFICGVALDLICIPASSPSCSCAVTSVTPPRSVNGILVRTSHKPVVILTNCWFPDRRIWMMLAVFCSSGGASDCGGCSTFRILISHTSVKFRIGNYHIEALSHGEKISSIESNNTRELLSGGVKGAWMRVKETCGFDCEDSGWGGEKKILEKGRVWACKDRKRQQKKATAPSVRRVIG
ncbi:hypothetical protein EDD16DRAFT_615538 [Pisolithus croceorrhizus]|nr:hypothetical protein EDD16DRAFT_615538 [Pisolithus croceorrhizus]KAI6167546.1 hypothetical protein EDD17DRAFT_942020 [Pisolithus thermaeus]